MEATRREAMGLIGGAAAVSVLAGAAAPAMAQGARKLGSASKALYWAATVTPCDKSGKFDPGAMRAIMQWQRAQGCDGLVVLGSSGEFASFSVAERKQVAEMVLKDKMGLNIMIGSGTANLPETLDLSKHAQANGADSLLVIPPFYFTGTSLDGLADYYSRIFDQCSLPINLYHYPALSKIPITIDLMKKLHQYPNLAGFKDSSGNADGYKAFVAAFPDLNMRTGTGNNLEVALENGMGTILADGNSMSKMCADIFTAYKTGKDWKAPLAKLRAANAIMRPAGEGANTYAVMKCVLGLQVGVEMYTRPPFQSVTEAQKASLKAALEKVKAMA